MTRRRYITWTTDVDVDIDLEELLDDLTDEELAECGLMRIPNGIQPPASPPPLNGHNLCSEGLDAHLIAVRTLRSGAAS